RAEPIGPLWQPFVFLALLGLVVFTLATLRFRSFLAPAAPRRGKGRAPAGPPPAGAEAGAPAAARPAGPPAGPAPPPPPGGRAMTALSPGPGQAGPAAPEWWGTDEASVRYGDRLALDHVTFRAVPGRVSAVVGGDGAGRTTLLRCLAGALAASSGQVRLPVPVRSREPSPGIEYFTGMVVTDTLVI